MFIPKIVHDQDSGPVEPSFPDDVELELPADLTILAERLSRDAVALAEHYPAGRGPARVGAGAGDQNRPAPPATTSSISARRYGRFLGPALAVLLLISAGVIVWRQTANRPDEGATSGTTIWSVSYRPENAIAEEQDAATYPPVQPASFVHELTGPEMEGFLDLLERDDAAEPRLSI